MSAPLSPYGLPTSPRANRPMLSPIDTSFSANQSRTPTSLSPYSDKSSVRTLVEPRHRNHDSLTRVLHHESAAASHVCFAALGAKNVRDAASQETLSSKRSARLATGPSTRKANHSGLAAVGDGQQQKRLATLKPHPYSSSKHRPARIFTCHSDSAALKQQTNFSTRVHKHGNISCYDVFFLYIFTNTPAGCISSVIHLPRLFDRASIDFYFLCFE
jgi:hypothetical protein